MYASLWDRHVLPRLGAFELRRLTPAVIEAFQAELRRENVGEPTILKTLTLLQGILQRAEVWGRIRANPVAAVRKPTQDVGQRTILVEPAVALGKVKETKTRQTRSVRLLAPLARDLREWRLKAGRPGDEALVFPRFDGAPWNEEDWRNWRQRISARAAAAAGLDNFRPYDLRHSFVSLLFAEGRTVIEVARQAGHSPTMALATYGHVMEELEGAEQSPAEDVIRAAESRLNTRFARLWTSAIDVPALQALSLDERKMDAHRASLGWQAEASSYKGLHGVSVATMRTWRPQPDQRWSPW